MFDRSISYRKQLKVIGDTGSDRMIYWPAGGQMTLSSELIKSETDTKKQNTHFSASRCSFKIC